MRIDLNNPPRPLDRHAAAKRASERTVAAAQEALKGGYEAPKRRKLAWDRPDRPPASTSSPTPSALLDEPRPAPLHQRPSSSQGLSSAGTRPQLQPHPHPQQPTSLPDLPPLSPRLSLRGTKEEQARLLGLLRTLNPFLVVDRLCTAVAHFGGIPGAPPPPSIHQFPESSANNGPGALFVSWMAEVFPSAESFLPSDLYHPAATYRPSASWPPRYAVPPLANASGLPYTEALPARPADVPVKRGRGRPRGSKGSRPRKDKGIKKGKLKKRAVASEASSSATLPAPVHPLAASNPTEEPGTSTSTPALAPSQQLRAPRGAGPDVEALSHYDTVATARLALEMQTRSRNPSHQGSDTHEPDGSDVALSSRAASEARSPPQPSAGPPTAQDGPRANSTASAATARRPLPEHSSQYTRRPKPPRPP